MLEHHPAGSCQFPCDGPDGDNAIRFGLFSLIEPFCQWLEAHSKMSALREGPGQVFVACFGIACAFLLAIAGALTVNTAAIRRKVARTGKAMDITGFQHDGQPEYFSNTGDRLEYLKGFC